MIAAAVGLLVYRLAFRRDRGRPSLRHALFVSHLTHRLFFRDETELLRRLR